MSRRKGHARKRRARTRKRDRATLLAAVAAALNDCERAGLGVRFLPGPMIHTRHGVVLPPHGKTGWTARVFGALPHSPAEGEGDED